MEGCFWISTFQKLSAVMGSEEEISSAISVLEKAKKEKQRKQQKEAFSKFEFNKI